MMESLSLEEGYVEESAESAATEEPTGKCS